MPLENATFMQVYWHVVRSLVMRAPWFLELYESTGATLDRAVEDHLSQDIKWPELRKKLSGPDVIGSRFTSLDEPLCPTGIAIRLGARIALAIATGNSHLLRRGELQLLRNSEHPEWAISAKASNEVFILPLIRAKIGDIFEVEYAFISRRSPRRAQRGTYLKSLTTLNVNVVDPDEYPINHRILIGNQWLDILSCNGFLFRPVLAPNSHQPVSLTRFIDAMRSGEAWRDHPLSFFDVGEACNESNFILHVDDIAEDEPPRTPVELRDHNDRLVEMQRRNERVVLFVSDNTLYKRFSYVKFRILVDHPYGLKDGTENTMLAWECENLRSWINPDPLVPRRVRDLFEIRYCPIEIEPILSAAIIAISLICQNLKKDPMNYTAPAVSELLSPHLQIIAVNKHPTESFNPYIDNIVKDKYGKPYLIRFIAQLALIGDIFKEALIGITQISKKAETLINQISYEFSYACEHNDRFTAEQVVAEMQKVVFKVVDSTPSLWVKGRMFYACFEGDDARRAVAALILAEATALAISIFSKGANEVLLSPPDNDQELDDEAMIAAAFAPQKDEETF